MTRRRPKTHWLIGFAALLALCGVGTRSARAEDLAAQEAARRQAIIAHLPADAAKRVFGEAANPTPGPTESVGSYARGCIAGAMPLPADGPDWQVMRPSRNRDWGNPALIRVVETLAAEVPALGWPGLLVGDMGQPRGGPMVTGHASHQIGLDVDIWLTPMPGRRLTPTERNNMAATNLVAADGNNVDRAVWGPQYRRLLEAAAELPETARIFVNPAIKRELCREAGSDRAWLRRIRPWWGHRTHFHLRISCPRGEPACRDQAPVPPGDGCGKELDWWFTYEARHPKPSPPSPPLLVSQLPPQCAAVAAAP
ncbi:MAG TPA: penicillin-insensitive murein endopeptidase [Stellaceae bacterium]|nr:penicillin-insensitive murein endopeptidase [Stellaceae bacterium]